MSIPDSVSEVTFFFMGHSNDDYENKLLAELERLNVGARVDPYLTDYDYDYHQLSLYVNTYPDGDVDLFLLEKHLRTAISNADISL